ncbi:class F sortase [Leifsonia sp. ZF2019]|uniref:class F sortase n=1 Tax=Leifsonia sp. ZF2019 TaxID=2781978 RepID=UPI001CBFAF46|nr:class F sortase [Leifsonia sp. ZF2019]UAJ79329.1 class F sortase [Leifsonia sp. ZF2019]
MKHRTQKLSLLLVAVIVACGLIVTGAVGLWETLNHPEARTALDMRGDSVELDPGEVPVPAASSRAVPDTGDRLIVSSVGLDVPIGALDAVGGQITPPGFTSAYVVRNMGVDLADGEEGTVFLVMHSLRNGAVGPGNYLADVTTRRSKLAIGASVEAAGHRYTVTGSQLVPKASIAENATVWANTPRRLLLITCLERADGTPSTQNLIITATG